MRCPARDARGRAIEAEGAANTEDLRALAFRREAEPHEAEAAQWRAAAAMARADLLRLADESA